MGVYFFIATLLFIFALWENRVELRPKTYMFIMTYFVLVIFDGLRWENGTDWGNYYDMFNLVDVEENSRFEIGYLFVNRVVYYLTGSYTVFLVLYAILLYGCLFFVFKRHSYSPLLSFFVFFVLFLPYQGMNRQLIAMAICLLAYHFLVEGEKKKFVLIVLGACLFHISAVIFFVSLLFVKRYDFRVYVCVLIIVIVLGGVGIAQFVVNKGLGLLSGHVAYLLEFYSESDNESAHGIGLIFAYFRRVIWVIPVFIQMMRNGNETMSRAAACSFNMYFFGCLLYILFNGTILQIFVSRAILYFSIFECLLIPYVVSLYNNNTFKTALYFVILLYGVANMYKGISSYDIGGNNPFIPYKSIYYNTSVNKETG